ncbi:MAG: aminodeoxychorismate synthase, component [Sphingomonas bacterium]|uniref:aminodeoxychorismate synthase component I n=1 Tax=Sphingomonas bacterium TaxID=1895847 RepID=UPI00260E6718|nr:aminodeoxychorismate synthase component I [Sphingomonas bacterium]MDB5703158.1 aminodeoxychorismate synthase, component [Sphingomonas bacterium]
MLARETTPFVLLDDAREEAAPARLYRRPVRVVEAGTIAAIRPALDDLRAARDAGLHAAGFLSYEAGAAFEPVLGTMPGSGAPLLWFGLFEDYEEIAPRDVPALLPDPAGAWIGAPEPGIDQAGYNRQLARVLDLIAAGDIYQANLSYRALVRYTGDPLALYAQLRGRARAGFGAFVDTGSDLLLSLSPELFFSLDDRRLACRPMKGTVRRGATPAEDRALAAGLAADPKQRAENLMIVDLMRNDLSRVARPGSVAVPALFTVETYPTVHTMVSTVTADLDEDRDAIHVLAALLPCGSVTGAPKIRAMQAIAEIEHASLPRGPYTGAIGRLDASGDAMFNVAIRTLAIRRGEAHAVFGVGGGIVADSTAHEEWDECLAKGDFLTAGQQGFDLIETMAFDPEVGLPLLEPHLARMKTSADLFGFAFDRHGARNELQAATFRLRRAKRVRLVLAKSGAIAIEVSPMPTPLARPAEVALVPLPVAPHDFRLRHKTSDRAFYDKARGGQFEVVFVDPDGFLTEGSFTSIFVERDGILVTPPLTRGLLPGILRAELLASGHAVEGELTAADLAGGFFVGNALRGLIPAIVAVANGKRTGL